MKYILLIISIATLATSQDKQLYTCGMHPTVIKEEMGICPICEMDLTPIKKDGADAEKSERKILYWRAPMNPNEIYEQAGKSKMGMTLVPVYSDEIEGAPVRISPQLQQNIGLRKDFPSFKNLAKEIRTNGNIQFDESRITHISLKYDLWVEESPIRYHGQHVKKGETLLSVYSPELVSAQQEYLSAIRSATVLGDAGNELIESARTRLEMWDISGETIKEITASGKAKKRVEIKSPASGIVTMFKAKRGHYAKKGDVILEIVDLSRLWLMIDITEKDLAFVRVGQNVEASLPYFGATSFNGKIDYIYPILDSKTRSAKARVLLKNKNQLLKVNMLVDATIDVPTESDVLAIPSEALIRTGKRTLVIIAAENNRFIPREVTVGRYLNGYYEILAGVTRSDEIVLSGQFLIDSESKLKEAIQKMVSKKADHQANAMRGDVSIAEISLPSIQCEMCVETITEALTSVAAVATAEIDLEGKIARVAFNTSEASQNDIEQVIANAGYHANNEKRNKAAYADLPLCCKED